LIALNVGNFVVDAPSKRISLLLLSLGSAPKATKAPAAVDVPVPPFAMDTIPVTFAALPVIFPDGVA
jgi:hypothetical protein